MDIRYSPQRSDDKLIYDFNKQKEKIKVIYKKCDYDYKNKKYKVKDEIQEIFDLTSIKIGEIINNIKTKKLPINLIIQVHRKMENY